MSNLREPPSLTNTQVVPRSRDALRRRAGLRAKMRSFTARIGRETRKNPIAGLENGDESIILLARAVGRMNELGKMLVIVGLVIAGIGLLIWTGFGRGWLGRLPGDIHYSKEPFSFHFPIVTCLLVTLVLTLLLWLFRK